MKIYRIFLASPSDTLKERKIIEKIINDINSILADTFEFRVELISYENNVIPGVGIDAQDVINQQIPLNYEIFVGVMWKKFGTPTKRAESGTAEEFKTALNKYINGNNVRIMFYFNDEPPSNLSEINVEQFSKVQDFKKELEKVGCLYFKYNGIDEFQNLLTRHLLKYLITVNKHLIIDETVVSENLIEKIKELYVNFTCKPLKDRREIYSKIYDIGYKIDINEIFDMENIKDVNSVIATAICIKSKLEKQNNENFETYSTQLLDFISRNINSNESKLRYRIYGIILTNNKLINLFIEQVKKNIPETTSTCIKITKQILNRV